MLAENRILILQSLLLVNLHHQDQILSRDQLRCYYTCFVSIQRHADFTRCGSGYGQGWFAW